MAQEPEDKEDEFHDAVEGEPSPGHDDEDSADEFASTTGVLPLPQTRSGDLTVEALQLEVVPEQQGSSARKYSAVIVQSELQDDEAVLRNTRFKNLDTNQEMSLAEALEVLPQGIDPLSVQIVQRHGVEDDADEEKEDSDVAEAVQSIGRSAEKLKAEGSKFMKKALRKSSTKSSSTLESEVVTSSPGVKIVHKGHEEFAGLHIVQQLSREDTGAIWTMTFSLDGRLLAGAGQDRVIRVWCVAGMETHFDDMRQKYSVPAGERATNTTAVPDTPETPASTPEAPTEKQTPPARPPPPTRVQPRTQPKRALRPIFSEKPYVEFLGHEGDVLDMCWSKNYFLLTSSMDKTVRLWHISQEQCLCVFQHPDFVTAISFHPKDDRFFISGSLDGRLRLWNIAQRKVALWNEVDSTSGGSMITAASFCANGRMVVVGTYDGRCLFYDSEKLKYHTQILVKRRGKKRGRKISGIIPVHGENKIIVSSNDSRVRLYDLTDFSLACKFRGAVNTRSQIRATTSLDANHVICGSENGNFYIWRIHAASKERDKLRFERRYHNDVCEAYSAHNAIVTVALFAPYNTAPGYKLDTEKAEGEIIVTADHDGRINISLALPRGRALTREGPWWADMPNTAVPSLES